MQSIGLFFWVIALGFAAKYVWKKSLKEFAAAGQ
jgi:ABC-type uncharacterized transport system permease subunit